MKNKNLIYEIVGWYGTIAIILAYAGNSFNYRFNKHLSAIQYGDPLLPFIVKFLQ